MKVYITKYALSSGIKEAEFIRHTASEGLIEARIEDVWENHFHKPHWHETMEEAVNRCEEMRTSKITSLKKQIAKLEKLKFG